MAELIARASSLLALIAALAACGGPGPSRPAVSTSAPAPRSALAAPKRFVALGVYTPDPLPEGAREAAIEAAMKLRPGLHLVADRETASALPALFVGAPPVASLPPPTDGMLEHFAVDLSAAEKRWLPRAKGVLAFSFVAGDEAHYETLRAAYAAVAEVARAHHGVVWDESTRQAFAADAWTRARLDAWHGAVPVAPMQVNVHVYEDGALLRMVTLGMEKLGLPDVAVEEVSRSHGPAMLSVVHLICQTLVEGGAPEADGALTLALDRVQEPATRRALLALAHESARRVGVVTLRAAKPKEGDAQNRLLRATFERMAGDGAQETQDALLGSLFGSEDHVVGVEHDAELLDASARARAKLAALAPRFAGTRPSRSQLVVKSPFETRSGGNEWMWVEVLRWEGDAIDGILVNDPFDVPELRAGARVRVSQREIFDYVLTGPDGGQEGGETNAILQAREAKRRTKKAPR